MSRDVISDETWALIGPTFPPVKSTGRPPFDRRVVVEATAWRFRTGAPWRDLPERFGNWNTIYKNFNRWSAAGVWAEVLKNVQSLVAGNGDLDWVESIDSTIVRVHQQIRQDCPQPPCRPLPRRHPPLAHDHLRRQGLRVVQSCFRIFTLVVSYPADSYIPRATALKPNTLSPNVRAPAARAWP